jgi:hypothetical protein
MIGKIIFKYDCNLRYYNRDSDGKSHGAPIYRKSFREHEIVEETSKSWVDRWDNKIPKKGGHGIAFSEEELDNLFYVHDNQYEISEAVRNVPYEKLIQVAAVIGYEPSKETK